MSNSVNSGKTAHSNRTSGAAASATSSGAEEAKPSFAAKAQAQSNVGSADVGPPQGKSPIAIGPNKSGGSSASNYASAVQARSRDDAKSGGSGAVENGRSKEVTPLASAAASRSSSTETSRRQSTVLNGPVSIRPTTLSPNLGVGSVNFGSTKSTGQTDPMPPPQSTSPALGGPGPQAQPGRAGGMNFGSVAATPRMPNSTRPPGGANLPVSSPPISAPTSASTSGVNTPVDTSATAAATAKAKPKANLANIFKGFSGASTTSMHAPRTEAGPEIRSSTPSDGPAAPQGDRPDLPKSGPMSPSATPSQRPPSMGPMSSNGQPMPYGYRSMPNGLGQLGSSPSSYMGQGANRSMYAGTPTSQPGMPSNMMHGAQPPHFGAGMNLGLNLDHQHRYGVGAPPPQQSSGGGPNGPFGNYPHLQQYNPQGQMGSGSFPQQGQPSGYPQHGYGPSPMTNAPSLTGSNSSTSTLPTSQHNLQNFGQHLGHGASMHSPSGPPYGHTQGSATPSSSTTAPSSAYRTSSYSSPMASTLSRSSTATTSTAPTNLRKSAAIRIFNPNTKEEVDMSAFKAAPKPQTPETKPVPTAATDSPVIPAPLPSSASAAQTPPPPALSESRAGTPPIVSTPGQVTPRKAIRIESVADRDARLKREAAEKAAEETAAADKVAESAASMPVVEQMATTEHKTEPASTATTAPAPAPTLPTEEASSQVAVETKTQAAGIEKEQVVPVVDPVPAPQLVEVANAAEKSADSLTTGTTQQAPAIQPEAPAQDLVKEERTLALEEEKASHPEQSDAIVKKEAQEKAAESVGADLAIVDGQATSPQVPIKASGTEAPLKDDNDLTTVPEIEPIAKSAPAAESTEQAPSEDQDIEEGGASETAQDSAASGLAQIEALKNARPITSFDEVKYPSSIKSPDFSLKQPTGTGNFRYDREFLLQFMEIITQKPAGFPPAETLGMDDLMPPPNTGKMGGKRGPASGASSPMRGSPVGPGLGPGAFGGNATAGGAFGQFSHPPRNSNERFMQSTVKMAQGIPPVRGAPMGRAAGDLGMARNASPVVIQQQQMQQQQQMAQQQQMQQQQMQGRKGPRRAGGAGPPRNGPQPILTLPIDQVAPLQTSENRWKPMTIGGKDRPALGANPNANANSPEMVQRKVKSLLNKLTVEKFESISNQIVEWANKSENEKDGRILRQVIQLVFEKATDEAHWSSMYAELCLKIQTQLKPAIMDEAVTNKEGVHITGGGLFRKYLLNRCQEDFQRGWAAAGEAAAAAAEKSSEDQAKIAANKAQEDDDTEKVETDAVVETKKPEKKEAAILSDEYYVAAKAKRRGLGLIRFIGELFKLSMLTERIMHECIKKLLSNVANPEEEEVESLTKLLSTIGKQLDTDKSRGLLDVYFQRLMEMSKNPNLNSRMQFMLLDVVELRKNGWHARREVGGPKTIEEIHADAERQRHNEELEKRAMAANSRSRGRGGFGTGHAPDGWTSVGQSQAPRKAGDLSRFGKMGGTSRSSTPGGPGGVFSMRGKNKGSGETSPASLSRSNSNVNMFGMLGDGQDPTKEPVVEPIKIEQPEPQRAKLELKPRSVAPEEVPEEATASIVASEDGESAAEAEEMTQETAERKMDNLLKEFWQIKDLDDAHDNVKELPPAYRVKMVEKLIEATLDRKVGDAEAAADLLEVIAEGGTLSKEQLEKAFAPVVEFVEDISIDAPSAYKFLGMLLDGANFTAEDVSRLSKPLEGLDGIVPPAEKLMKAYVQATTD